MVTGSSGNECKYAIVDDDGFFVLRGIHNRPYVKPLYDSYEEAYQAMLEYVYQEDCDETWFDSVEEAIQDYIDNFCDEDSQPTVQSVLDAIGTEHYDTYGQIINKQ